MTDKAVNCQTLEIVNLGRHPLRLTELGAAPLKNGDKFLVSTDLAKNLSWRYPTMVKLSPTVTQKALKNGTWEPASGKSEATASTASAPQKEEAPKVAAKAKDKSMASSGKSVVASK